MKITISSGNSVDEVCRALWHFLQWLKKDYLFEIKHLEYTLCENAYKSIVLESEDSKFWALEGTHLWKSQSPFRPKHKRKNWYFTLLCEREDEEILFDESKVIYQSMKSPKKGGQHVNTTNSGVRAVYKPINLEAISYDERSQYRNKSIALKRLKEKVLVLCEEKKALEKNKSWKESKTFERGNTVKIFEGERFIMQCKACVLYTY